MSPTASGVRVRLAPDFVRAPRAGSPDKPASSRRRSHLHTGSITVVAVALVLTAMPAYAYVDPATGGMLAQYFTAGLAGVAILLRLYWKRMTDDVGRGLGRFRTSRRR
jgi:Na+/proline symporter